MAGSGLFSLSLASWLIVDDRWGAWASGFLCAWAICYSERVGVTP